MDVQGTWIVFLLSSLCLYLFFVFIKFIHKVWWNPIRLKRVMSSQGIRGPAYRFLYGNTKEILKMKKESLRRPMDLSSHNLFPRIHPHISTWINIYGRNFQSWFGPRAQLVVTEPGLIKEILNRDEVFKKAELDVYVKKLLGDGLVASEGEKWVKQRRLANHAFHGESLKGMTPVMISSVEMMLQRWKQHEGKEIDVLEEFKLLTSEVISRTAFGSSYLEGKDIFEMLMRLVNIIGRNQFRIRIPGLSKIFKSRDDLESDKIEEGIRDSIIGMVKRRVTGMNEEVDGYGADFLGLLIKANNDSDESNRITINDLVDECKTFYIAGQETTAGLLSWTFVLLGIHTDWQEKARKEVLNQFGQQLPYTEGIAKLKTINMIINETLRLYPSVVDFSREVKQEAKLGKLILPAKLNVMIPPLAVHQDTKIWGEDAHQFKPERFSEGVAKATNNNPAVFLPFGFGLRSCVGLNFATNEAKIALSMILQRYSFTLSPTYIHSPVHAFTVQPQHGVQVVLHAL